MEEGGDLIAMKNNHPKMPDIDRRCIMMVPIERILPYRMNPRNHDATIPVLMDSIRQFGFNVPIIIEKDFFIVCGHARWIAAMRLGREELPCIRVTDLTPQQIHAFRLVDNKTAEQAEWNKDALRCEIGNLKDFDLKPFDFKPLLKKEDKDTGALSREFIVPPFSVIRGKGSTCMDLDVKWASRYCPYEKNYPAHICEVLFSWFTPPGGTILSPTCESDAMKYIATELGYKFLDSLPSEEETDMLYLNLFSTAAQSMSLDDTTLNLIKGAACTLSDNRFIVAAVQECNDKSMGYRSTKGSELETFLHELGFEYYNELIHVYKDASELDDDNESFLRTRIVPSRHLTIMVFYKGEIKKIRDIFPKTCTVEKEVCLSA